MDRNRCAHKHSLACLLTHTHMLRNDGTFGLSVTMLHHKAAMILEIFTIFSVRRLVYAFLRSSFFLRCSSFSLLLAILFCAHCFERAVPETIEHVTESMMCRNQYPMWRYITRTQSQQTFFDTDHRKKTYAGEQQQNRHEPAKVLMFFFLFALNFSRMRKKTFFLLFTLVSIEKEREKNQRCMHGR